MKSKSKTKAFFSKLFGEKKVEEKAQLQALAPTERKPEEDAQPQVSNPHPAGRQNDATASTPQYYIDLSEPSEETENPRQDVERYLRDSLKTIQRNKFPHTLTGESWPGEAKIMKLVNAAAGLFAFANVAVRFIEDPNHADPTARLNKVLTIIDGGSKFSSVNDQPLTHLDAMYSHILTRIPSKMWQITHRVLGVISGAEHCPPQLKCIKGLSVVLGLDSGKVYASIKGLYPLLDVPPLGNVYSEQLAYHHSSLNDFLGDATRSKKFYVSPNDVKIDIRESYHRIWLDFKKSSQGPSSEYKDRWSKYVSQFHSGPNSSAEVSNGFNDSLFRNTHFHTWRVLQEKNTVAQTNPSKVNWDRFLDLLSQVDAGTLIYGFGGLVAASPVYLNEFIRLWFHLWEEYRQELVDRRMISAIRLEQLQLGHLQWPRECPAHTRVVHNRENEFSAMVFANPSSSESFDKYISGLKYIQQHNPKHPVLVCGTLRNRIAMFSYTYTEKDFTPERLIHVGSDGRNGPRFDLYSYEGYYCIPYSKSV